MDKKFKACKLECDLKGIFTKLSKATIHDSWHTSSIWDEIKDILEQKYFANVDIDQMLSEC